VKYPTPAIVSQHAVRRLPRLAIWLFCLAYVVPGFLGREVWKGGEFNAFGHMLALAEGQSDWFHIEIWGKVPELRALLPYWIGAWAIQLANALGIDGLSASLAVRIPYAFLLSFTLLIVWYSAYYFARTPQAQPVNFAFGGEASPKDYARTIADGALLGLIASLGLALLSHEASPILAQLTFISLAFYAIAILPFHAIKGWVALIIGFAGLTLSGAPAYSQILLLGCIVFQIIHDKQNQQHSFHLWGLIALSAGLFALSHKLELWESHLRPNPFGADNLKGFGNLIIWFIWPLWPLTLWTLWIWRQHWVSMRLSRHLIIPLWFALTSIVSSFLTYTSEDTMLLALPALSILASFALPTFKRSASALVDWFTLIFFTGCAIIIWVVWLSMHTGIPPQPAINVARLASGFIPSFTWISLICAVIATLLWMGLVAWRIGRNRHPLWKSVILPAGGAALCWLLLMTLWLPLLNYARSYQPWITQVRTMMNQQGAPAQNCIMTYGLNLGQMSAFHYYAGYQISSLDDISKPQKAICEWLLIDSDLRPELSTVVHLKEWQRIGSVKRPADRDENVILYKRWQK
jgi:4-amino-4-deoxy-L-arabinose transferase-like glycosyltransferase